MKKALFLLLASLSATVAFAGPSPAANVNFASERGVPFAVVLDGRPLTRGLARQVHAERLLPGLHYADISVPTPYGGAVRLRSRVWLEPGLETTFVLIARPGRPLDLRQAGAVALYYPGHGGHGGHCADDRGRSDDDRGRYGRTSSYGSGGTASTYPAPPYGQRPNQPDPAYNQQQGGSYNQNPNSQNPNGGYNQPADGNTDYYNDDNNGSYQVMAAPDVNGLAEALNRCSFEDERLQMAKQALSQTSIRADDLARLLLSFHFDTSRVEFAKYAYPHVADRQNFYRVYPSFDFNAHAREVQAAVAQM